MATGRTEDFSSRGRKDTRNTHTHTHTHTSTLPHTHAHIHTLTLAGVSSTITLPPSLFNNVPADRPVIGVYFALYESPTLLPATRVTNNETFASTEVGSPIVAATVGPGIDFVDLNPPVTITLGLLPFTSNVSVSWPL